VTAHHVNMVLASTQSRDIFVFVRKDIMDTILILVSLFRSRRTVFLVSQRVQQEGMWCLL